MQLKFLVREVFSVAVRFSGLSALLRWARGDRLAAILMYHDPDPEVFAVHLAYYARHYSFVTLDELVQALRQGRWDSLPPRPLVLTMDDGHKGNRALQDLCRSYGVRPTIYLCSQIVGTHRHFWWLHGDMAKNPAKAEEMKELTLEQSAEYLRSNYGFDPRKEYEDRQALSREDLAQMGRDFDLQSHGRTHRILLRLPDQACREEIFTSRREVEELTGSPCRHFAYPNGDYSEREKRYLAEAGYHSARSTDYDWVRPDSDPFALPILGINDRSTRNWAEATLTGIPGKVSNLLKAVTGGKKKPVPPQDPVKS